MATIYTPARQPFGILDDSKLRSLQSMKNRQNALVPTSTLSLKRRAPSPELSDSENIDPSIFDASSKRKRTLLENDEPVAKKLCSSTYVMPTSTSSTAYKSPCVSSTVTQTPRLDAYSRQASNVTPASAPAVVTFAAGRSPTRLNTRVERPLSQPRRRFVPPSFNQNSPSISIKSALKGTLSHKRSASRQHRKQSRLLEEPQPKSWHFEIYEEPEETQNYRMSEWTMTQSSAALDISDDESKSKSGLGQADRGKENIDPNEALTNSVPVTRAAAAVARQAEAENEKDGMKTEEPRTPLGDLKTADYYGEGLDATSVVLVHDEEPVVPDAEEEPPIPDQSLDSTQSAAESIFTFTKPQPLQLSSEEHIVAEEVPAWAQRSLSSVDIDSETKQDDIDSLMPVHEPGAEPAIIDIWESESAKDENETSEGNGSSNVITVLDGETVSASAFYLQEL